MIDFEALLAGVIGHAPPDGLAEAMAESLPRYEINIPLRIAHFIGQTAEETGGYRYLHELGGPDYFARYDGRADLGNTEPDDGARYKGRGLLQITGRANYARIGQALGVDLINHPELAETVSVAVETACLYWRDHNLNTLADQDNIVAITKRVNGGLNGFSVRKSYTARAKALLDQLAQQAPIPAPVAAPGPDPVQVAPEQPAPVLSDPGGSYREPDDTFQIPSYARSLWTAYGHRGLAMATGVIGTVAAFLQAHPVEAVLLAFLAIFLGLVLVKWTRDREARKQAVLKAALATPAPTQPVQTLSDADIARIAAAVAAIRGQAA